ncbi:radical SAM protein [Streptomyces sp. CB01881]|uniref:radical SAM protein n=2 Tax=Streptomyces sp. CB01881 TaxID=2078691 RepID=UPI000CDC32E8|nr:radical SAM protein [Streptomyces sp. CB01881]AUY52311.1 radical SAM protein [Streptomyces sp. CB01881]TYC71732.1 radical SAM protein [Streptomyces sp. CB01881]
MTAIMEPPVSAGLAIPHMIELEITGKCQLQCAHCLSDSAPSVPHGVMKLADWYGVIDQAAELGIGKVQLIGGEPTTFPGWADLVDHALSRGRAVEVFTNLFHVSAKGWAVFERPGVSLATSYYSPNPGEHDRVTLVSGSHERTRANIAEAVRRGIPIRAGVVGVHDGQLEQLAVEELRALGVQHVTLDYARGVGRAAKSTPTVGELCGNCGRGRLAVMPDGSVSPCVLGRWMKPGHAKQPGGIRAVLDSPEWAAVVASIPERRPATLGGCPPNDSNDCSPANSPACNPAYGFAPASLGGCPPNDSNDCSPANTPACNPAYGVAPVAVALGGCPPNDSQTCNPANPAPCNPVFGVSEL